MILNKVSRVMGERRLKTSDIVRDTGINRGTITRLYKDTAERVDLAVLQTLCTYFDCDLNELLEITPSKDAMPES